MNWPVSLAIGLATAIFAAFYGFLVAHAAGEWLRIPAFEGTFGYFVVFCALVALVAGLIIGILVGRLWAGGGGWWTLVRAVVVAGALITALGGLAWLSDRREPPLRAPLDLLLDIRVPVALVATMAERGELPFVILYGGETWRRGDITAQAGSGDDGRALLAARVEIHNAAARRQIGVFLRVAPEQFFDLPLPAMPQPSTAWSDWLGASRLLDGSAPAPEEAFALRFRVVPRLAEAGPSQP
ncbi:MULTISPECIES: hypothetical protein [Chelatococcus]|uniref:Uncharacterized protein n=1 Tax=Chelatococcus caeni TaxID=1348468 RepID=A0A840C4U7_9HYPH|nr:MULTISPECIES: hypothetical protein [Chelatococcus]ALA16823.1 hypothetical protein AL346_04615 [Chelatococcus sp. CO-6]MBB4019863.1 hypothetical protein [Chelatococcus caeni]